MTERKSFATFGSLGTFESPSYPIRHGLVIDRNDSNDPTDPVALTAGE